LNTIQNVFPNDTRVSLLPASMTLTKVFLIRSFH